MNKLSIRDLDAAGKEVLMRVDFNVPLNDAGEITDDTRIRAALPSIEHLQKAGAKLVLCSHLGRPGGKPDSKYSLQPAATRLGELLGSEVAFASDCVGESADSARAALTDGGVLILENTRFHEAETKNEGDFAKALAGGAEIFVNDAFGTAHRAHASTEGVTHHVSQSAMGFLMERELEYLVGKISEPARPFLVIMGGAKVSDKIEVITALLEKADTILIGGAMAYTFRKAQGHEVGMSLVENDKLDLALDILKKAEEKGVKFLLPADTLITQEFKNGAETKNIAPYNEGGSIPADWEGIDIGEKAIAEFKEVVAEAKTIVWNGPMGVFEIDSFARGTKEIAEAVAASDAISIVGGGDSVTAAVKFDVADKMTFISTGGGASLELLEGKELPGVAALSEA
ncbi:phosphoglycerate kinase [Roseibacillus ishigakijimensis]|uniref:Phosphoglycerate kinase n=1 Tax=Roseibacillus ishigakijimensis TaxID=454146 RepID=A0A934RNF9_9BACT|nr:phosphoglycerate kinase [Roseibacillus ishigakijimensis]MBK1834038.1 phosphoglycerate kinase [Roseibacillus ishigakijimensis]